MNLLKSCIEYGLTIDSSVNAFFIQSLATVFQNGRHLGSHRERRYWPQYCL